MWYSFVPGLVLGIDISFQNYGDGYIEVVADGISCYDNNETFVLQHSYDSSRIRGSAQKPLPKGEYGTVKSARDAAYSSGMFIPEFNTGTSSRSVEEMWNDWAINGRVNDDEVYSFKYSPTGKIFLRQAGSSDANEALGKALAQLPGLDYIPFNYSKFDEYYSEPWKKHTGKDENGFSHEAFPGMMPLIHPVYPDPNKPETNGHQKYAVKKCPGSTGDEGKCCLVVEGHTSENQLVNPVGFGLDATLEKADVGALPEYSLTWQQLASHTSFSRGVPDLFFYTPSQLKEDFSKRPVGTDQTILDKLQSALSDIKGSGFSSNVQGNEFKCKQPSEDSLANDQQPNEWSFYAASRLEHFYSAVVGAEEAGMLRQKISEWDGANVNIDNFGENGDEADGNGQWNPDCTKQPGGHCGFGYYCASAEATGDWEGCPQFRWRGRPEAIRFDGDNSDNGIKQSMHPFNSTWKTYPHVLDGERGAWYDAEYRMSARLVFTGGDGHSQETELPCSITAYIDVVDNVVGDFSRACSKLRATKFEWLIAAMLQGHEFESEDLNRNGQNDQGYWWENGRGVGPTPCSYNSEICYMNTRNNRVKMWDMDETWDLDDFNNKYLGAEVESEQNSFDDTYFKRLRNLRQVPGVGIPFDIDTDSDHPQPPMFRNFRQADTQYGASDGTSRTDPHSMACYISPNAILPTDDSDNDYFNRYGDTNTYYVPKPSLWPFQWGLSRSIGSDVDWSSPAGCDIYYGPPCLFKDAKSNYHYSQSYTNKGRRMASKTQGTDGVMSCGRIADEGTRATWDAQSTTSRGKYMHGSHTCSNLGNATHFKLWDLDDAETGEEYDFRATVHHKYGIRNCNVGYCQDAPISIGCHFPMNDESTEVHTFFFNGTYGTEKYSWFAFNNDNRGAPENSGNYQVPIDSSSNPWAQRSANGKVVNPFVAWVNWGKKLETSNIQVGERLSNMHSPYQDGKRDGILECGKPAEDLLLYSLAKSVEFCVPGNENFTKISACRKPGDYAKWLLNHGESEKGLATPTTFQPIFNSGRYNRRGINYQEGTVQLLGNCSTAVRGCDCGYLARTTRIVVGAPEKSPFTERKPYAPHWVNNNTDAVWCAGDAEDRAFKPRRVCEKQTLFQTPFWSGSPVSPEQNFPSALSARKEDIKYVRRENTVWNRAELEQMKLCVNSDDGQVCNDVPDVLLGSALVSVKKQQTDEVQVALPLEAGKDCKNLDQDIDAFNGFGLTKVGLNRPAAFSRAAGPPHYCLLERGNGQPNPALWQVNLTPDGTISKDNVANLIDEYELLRISQCLDDSLSCPQVTTQKLMDIGVPTDICNGRPRISYACEEEDDNGNLIEQEPQLEFLIGTEETVTSGNFKYTHLIKFKCLNRMNFFIQCDDSSELSALYTSLCGNTNGCELPTKFKMCSYNPFTSNMFRKFEISIPNSTFFEDPLEESDLAADFNLENCVCDQELLIFQNENNLCYVTSPSSRSFPQNLLSAKHYLCTSTYRVVELRDYRPDLPLQVAWGACDSLRVKYSGEEDHTDAKLEPTRGLAPSGGDFRADLPIPLTRKSSEQYGEAGFTWKDGTLRELVPQGCRSKFQTSSSSIFSRRVAFDNNPGEPMSMQEYGKCPNGEIFCANKTDVYIKNVQMWETNFVQPMKQHYGRADDCPLFCKGTLDCTAVSFDPEKKMCSLYKNLTGIVQLDVVDTGSLVEDTFENLVSGVSGIFMCIGPEIQQIFPPPPPVASLRECPSGHSLVQFPGTPGKCVRSTCNPDTEMGVHLFPKKECLGECFDLCNNAPGRELIAHTAQRPAIWNILSPPPNPGSVFIDYSYSPNMSLAYRPTFEYAFTNIQYESVSELKQIEFFLPPIRIVNCSELKNMTSPMVQEQIDYEWSLRVSDTDEELASGSGTENVSFLLKNTHSITQIIIRDGIDIPVQDFASLRLNITTSQPTQAMQNAIMFIVEAPDCPCSAVNTNGTGVAAYTAQQQENFETTSPAYQNASNQFHCKVPYPDEPVATFGTAGFANLKVCNIAPNPEVCMPHTPCKEDEEFLLHPGNLENDNVCAKQRYCLENEFENASATPTSSRECVVYRECTSLEYQALAATPTTQRKCEYLEPCGSGTEYRNRESNECVQITECSGDLPKIGTGATPYSDVECTKYTIECSETQYETNPRTSSTEKVCTEATICAPEEFSSLEASLTSDRKCTPMLECSVHQIEHSPNDFESDVFCEPVVHFSIAWFMGIAYCVVFGGTYFWVVFGRAHYTKETTTLS